MRAENAGSHPTVQPWLASLFGGFAGFVLAWLPLAAAPKAGVRELVFALTCAGIGVLVGNQIPRRWNWVRSGGLGQMTLAATLGGATGLLTFAATRAVLLWSSTHPVRDALVWTGSGSIAAMMIVFLIWVHGGGVPYQAQR